MENEVTIYYNDFNSQPAIIEDCSSIEIKRDNILVKGRGFQKVFFKDNIKQISAGYRVRIYVK